MMKSIVADTQFSKAVTKRSQPQRPQNDSEQIEESERRAVADYKGHRTQQHSAIKRRREK